MNTVLRWLLCTAATVALVTVFANYPKVGNNIISDTDTSHAAHTTPIPVAETTVIDSVPAAEKQGYFLKEHDGRLAVFAAGSSEPLYVFHVSIGTMSDFDKDALREGIFAQDLTELRDLVEDYTS